MVNKRVFTEEQSLRIVQAYQFETLSTHKLAKEMMCSPATIIRVLRENNIQIASTPSLRSIRYTPEQDIIINPSNEHSDYYVYFHRNLSTHEIFYVGKGRLKRATERSSRGQAWYKYVKKHGYSSGIHQDGLTNEQALQLEMELIRLTPNLVNHCIPTDREILTTEECSKYFQYNPTSPSCLDRLAGTWTGGYYKGEIGPTGTIVTNKKSGYSRWILNFKNRQVQVHHLVWVLCKGIIPKGYVIDHINGDSCDNRIENLRCVLQGENCKNKKKNKRNVSGVTGVFWFEDKYSFGYRASCLYNYKKYSKRFYVHEHGLLPAFTLAVQWRQEKIKELNEQGAGYTDRHGT